VPIARRRRTTGIDGAIIGGVRNLHLDGSDATSGKLRTGGVRNLDLDGGESIDWQVAHGDRAAIELAARFHSVATSGQLAAVGLSRRWIADRVQRGWLTRMHRGVYLVGPRPGPWSREAAALLACGDGAVLSHRSAGALWSLVARAPGDVDVTLRQGNRGGRDGIRIHRSPLEARDVAVRLELAVTSPIRTLLDLAAVLPQAELDRAVNEAQVRRLVTAEQLHRVAARRPGATALRRSLADEPRVTRSALERRMLALVRRVGLPLPRTNAIVEGHEVDFLWPDQRLIVETDGHHAHSTRARFESDRARDARLVAAGYVVLRFTWRQLVEEPEVVAARLAAALARAGSSSRQAARWASPSAA
jgi:very-short-patch-repair endonuclease